MRNNWIKIIIAAMLINAIGGVLMIAESGGNLSNYILWAGMILFVVGVIGLLVQVLRRKPSH